MKVAIIGSEGMIGFDLIQYLKSSFEIVGINRKNYKQYIGQSFDIVINANGNSRKFWANENALADFEASTASVYHSIMDFPCKTYIYLSAADVYPDHANSPSEEAAITPEWLSPYGLHKYLSECIIRCREENYIILRCPLMLGRKLKKGPIYDIAHGKLFVSEKSAFQMITTKGLAEIIDTLLKQDIMGIFNIGGTGKVPLSEITTATHEGEAQTYEMDVTKLNKIYPLKSSREYLQDFYD